jgi:hypothetical protein
MHVIMIRMLKLIRDVFMHAVELGIWAKESLSIARDDQARFNIEQLRKAHTKEADRLVPKI